MSVGQRATARLTPTTTKRESSIGHSTAISRQFAPSSPKNQGSISSRCLLRVRLDRYKLLGTREWFVVHHTDCGMLLFTNDDMRSLLASSLKTATLDQSGWHDSGERPGSTEGSYINWLTFTDTAKSVVEDVMRIRNHPLVPNDIPIYGYIYDVTTGKLVEVPEAMTAGKAS